MTGTVVTFGSSQALLQQLTTLNNETLNGTEEDLSLWAYEGAGSGDPFVKSAQFGIAMFIRHARLSVEHRLPMKLDY